MSQGISTWHPSHQVAQKLTRTTFPFRLESLTSLPLTSCKVKSGASFRSFSGLRSAGTGPEAEKLCQKATVHSRQRCEHSRCRESQEAQAGSKGCRCGPGPPLVDADSPAKQLLETRKSGGGVWLPLVSPIQCGHALVYPRAELR